MHDAISLFLHERLDATVESLRKSSAEYALAAEKRLALYEAIDPILRSREGLTISAGDCQNFRDYFDQEFIVTAVMQEELYKQGWRDCAALLRSLGV